MTAHLSSAFVCKIDDTQYPLDRVVVHRKEHVTFCVGSLSIVKLA